MKDGFRDLDRCMTSAMFIVVVFVVLISMVTVHLHLDGIESQITCEAEN